MKTGMKRILLVALVICMVATTASAAQYGIATHMGLWNNYANSTNVEKAAATHVSWVRDECRWQVTQTTAGGAYNIRAKDLDYMRRLEAEGINQLLVLSYGNPAYDENAPMPRTSDPTYYQAWLGYVRYTVSQVKDYVDAYEIWNEPDNSGFNYNLLGTPQDYGRLYLDSKAIIDELDPTATVVCGSIAGNDSNAHNYAKGILSYIQSQGNVNQLIDAFSVHAYPVYFSRVENTSYYPAWLNNWESIFDSYGYTGDVWLTETGISSASGKASVTEQAYSVPIISAIWENYLKTNNRSGEIFWYDLRNDGTTASEYEHNLGVFDYDYNPKLSHYAMKAYNDLTGGKTFVSKQDYKSKSSIVQYNGTNDTVYLLWDSNNSGTSRAVPVSGDVAYVYDYQGNVTRTINSPSGTTSVNVYSAPIYVRSMSYTSSIDSCTYDANNGIVSVSGQFNGGDSVTIEVLQYGSTVVKTVTAPVTDGSFDKWFSFSGDAGIYSVRVAQPELTALGKQSGWPTSNFVVSASGETAPAFAASTQISYNAATRKVNVSGTVTDYVEGQQVTVLAIPASMSTASVDMNAVACVKQIPATNGTFSTEFDVPPYFTTNMKVYLGGTDIASQMSGTASIGEGDYVYVASLDLSKGSSLTATALINNFTGTAKQATMVIAQYNGNKLVKTNKSVQNVAANSYATLEYTLSGVAIQSGATSAKAYVWDDLTNMMPLVGFEDVSLN